MNCRVTSWITMFTLGVSTLPAVASQAPSSDGVSQVELQWVVCEKTPADFFARANVHAPAPKQREVFFAETVNLDLYRADAIVRTRRSASKIKTAAKIKNLRESDIPWNLLAPGESKCEVDAYAEHQGIGCSVYSTPTDQHPILSPQQKTFLKVAANIDDFEELQRWGPIQSREWTWHERSLKVDLTVEETSLQNSGSSLELSVRVPLSQQTETRRHIQNWLDQKGVRLCPDQVGSTGKWLEILVSPSTRQRPEL